MYTAFNIPDCPLPPVSFIAETPADLITRYKALTLGPIQTARAEANAQAFNLTEAIKTHFTAATVAQLREVRAKAVEAVQNELDLRAQVDNLLLEYRKAIMGLLDKARAARKAAAARVFGNVLKAGFDEAAKDQQALAEPLLTWHPDVRAADARVKYFTDALEPLDNFDAKDAAGNLASPFCANAERHAALEETLQTEVRTFLAEQGVAGTVRQAYESGADIEGLQPPLTSDRTHA